MSSGRDHLARVIPHAAAAENLGLESAEARPPQVAAAVGKGRMMRYEVRIAGAMPEITARTAFPEWDRRVLPAQTILRGQIVDEAHLYGLLARLRELGVHVREVRRAPA